MKFNAWIWKSVVLEHCSSLMIRSYIEQNFNRWVPGKLHLSTMEFYKGNGEFGLSKYVEVEFPHPTIRRFSLFFNKHDVFVMHKHVAFRFRLDKWIEVDEMIKSLQERNPWDLKNA
mgnify:CR=1 FL=1